MQKFEYARVIEEERDPDVLPSATLEDMLSMGWEPYAVTLGSVDQTDWDNRKGRPSTFVHHLRRPIATRKPRAKKAAK